MSILETPRILFRGEIAWDPITTNNYPSNYDENTCETDFTCGKDVAAFRQSAIQQVATDGNWNPHGTHRSTFFNTYISGVDTGSGPVTTDPFQGAPVDFMGMLVDCEPYGATSSQLFFDAISLGISGGCRIFAPRGARIHDRYINFNRNPSNNMIAGVASVMWQTSFAKDAGLLIDSHDSAALQALEIALGDPTVLGLTVRWNTYRTVYYDDEKLSNPTSGPAAEALIAKLNEGGWQPNPARSLVIGAVGLWRAGEAMFEPSDRALIATNAAFTGYPPPNNRGGVGVASAHARFDQNSVTLDLSNCIPEVNRAPDKFDLGTLELVYVDPTDNQTVLGSVCTLASSDYGKTAYENGSGIVTKPCDEGFAEFASVANLMLRTTEATAFLDAKTPLAVEVPLRAIPLQPNLYLDEGDTVTTEVQLYNRGVPAGAGIDVTLALVGANSAAGDTQTTGDDGTVSFSLSGNTDSVDMYALVPDHQMPLPIGGVDPQISTYLTVRTLPADAAIAALDPTWDNVHTHVLANWEAMAPCMDNWLRLGDEQQVKRYGPYLKQLTDPANFESFMYMPVVRDMTPGQRTLLYNWIDGSGGAVTEARATKARLAATPEPDLAMMGRAMRGN